MDQRVAVASDDADVLDWMQRSEIGCRNGDGDGVGIFVARDEGPGPLLYGPFWRLWPGAYRLAITAGIGVPRVPSQVVLGVEVIADNRQQLAWRDFTADEMAASGGVAYIDFDVSPELSRDAATAAIFEFKLFHAGNADLAIQSIVLRRRTAAPPAATPQRRTWRLPVRGDPQAAATMDAGDFVAVSRRARAGQFIYPVQPPVALPAGSYRLCFGSRATRIRTERRPLLNVVIVAGGAAQYESWFYAAELAAGQCYVDFAIPPELGVEAGAPGLVEIRFMHVGNADLAVGDVELVLANTDAEGSAPSPPAELARFVDPGERDRGLPATVWRRLSLALLPPILPPGVRLDHSSRHGALARVDIRKDRISRRKNVVIIGNCHAALIHEGFRAVPALAQRFDAKYQNIHVPERFYAQAKRELEDCELLVVQDISDWEHHPLREWVGAQAEIVQFPCVRFASLWPFDACNGLPDPVALALEAPNLTFPYLDGLLARLRKEIPDPARRFDAYCALAIESGVPNYRRAHDFESRRLLALDKKFSCKIGEFVLDRFRDEQVFYTTDHPNGRVFALMMANIMQMLGVAGEVPDDIPGLDQLRTIQVPVHPLVAEALGVSWVRPERTYQFRQEHLTWEEYFRRYIACYG